MVPELRHGSAQHQQRTRSINRPLNSGGLLLLWGRMQHPFAGRAGRARRDAFAIGLYVEQGGKCRMCGVSLQPSLRGKISARSAVVDHVRPWRLEPWLSYEQSNMQLICRACHAVCDSIEKRMTPDAAAIERAKRAHNPVGLDGYRAKGRG
jgi:5-methylcytosine-specific restriction endonuclease McrA